ncbi:hypothetical protein PFICI_02957 [Pestalotiopsis fici W106-1]|uniref:SMODS and SLOG-associating 2TM effector domain-containing protein n=1 Tax=Pestalotiopsis fici (strain W106-1 / CGMCC3.15140) TaxID=1229662 RepID=W3XHL7_PESFW|nr:uncharacterized protein PFICI_02957 [Pestalotiopsis fici W106-1]ETS84932.1 hypothetical protein PFICI_02957 [Pestalotiopsis fici W106-1]
MSLLRSPALTNALGMANLTALGAVTLYFKSHHEYNLQEHEARMDELEGTLRGHIGLIEDSLERLEGGAEATVPRGSKSERAEKLYTSRGKDEKK